MHLQTVSPGSLAVFEEFERAKKAAKPEGAWERDN